ncbi:MAG: hypothetical protein M3442_03970 [Chloroflexota bacterium]|nr:hypothetical protein [Chloroflexota bacterium]
MTSELVSIIGEELRRQRTFLSTDEVAALDRSADAEDEEDLALDRVRRRRLVLYAALRDRFIRDGRPLEDWRAMVEREEAAAGGKTIVSQLARQVLEWAVRTSDRQAMLGGFAAKTLRWIGMILLALGGWSWFQGAVGGIVAVVLVLGLAALLAGRIVGNLAADRIALLTEQFGGQEAVER